MTAHRQFAKVRRAALAAIACVLPWAASHADPSISELMIENVTTLADEDGEFPAWVEIRGSGLTVDLGNYALLSSGGLPWPLPAGRLLAQGEFVVVFLSGKDRSPMNGELHTDFVTHPLSPTVQLLEISPGIRFLDFARDDRLLVSGDVSVDTDGDRLAAPTPGLANAPPGGGFQGGGIAFSMPSGYYDQPIDVALNTASPLEIRYTMDGSPPTAGNGMLYQDPIPISTTTILRARFIDPTTGATSLVFNASYLFIDDILQQSPNGEVPPRWPISPQNGQEFDYGMDPDIVNAFTPAEWRTAFESIPAVSLVIRPEHLTGSTFGIYSNALNRQQTERARPVHIDFFTYDGSEQFSERAALRMRGGVSRNGRFPKHSFRIEFNRFQDEGQLRYPVFGPGGSARFTYLALKTSGNYSWAGESDAAQGNQETMVREGFVRDLQHAMKQPAAHDRYCHLFLNGHYWGLYQLQNHLSEHFGKIYLKGGRGYTVMRSSNHEGGFVTEVTNGSLFFWTDLLIAVQAVAHDPSPANYFHLLGRDVHGVPIPGGEPLIDIDNFIDYLLVLYYAGDGASPISQFLANDRPNNWYGFSHGRAPVGFRFLASDSEHVFGATGSREDSTGPFLSVNQANPDFSNPQWIHQDLMASEEYRLRFADRIRKHMFGGVLTDQRATEIFDARVNRVDPLIIAESARWGDAKKAAPYTKTDWTNEIGRIRNTVLPGRRDAVLQQLIDDGLYPGTPAPDFQIVPVVPGITVRFLSQVGGDIWWTRDGSDPRLPGGGISPDAMLSAPNEAVTSEETLRIKARTLLGGVWSALSDATFVIGAEPLPGDIAMTEFYFERDGDSEEQYIELKNVRDVPVDLTGLRFVSGISFDFAHGDIRSLKSCETVLVVRNRAAFEDRFGTGLPIAGEFENGSRLDKRGERILLVKGEAPSEVTMVDCTYSRGGAWSSSYVFTLRDPAPTPDYSNPASWTNFGFTPGIDRNLLQPYAAWLAREGVADEPLSDHDMDGLPLLLEYVFASSATKPDPEDGLEVRFPESPNQFVEISYHYNQLARDVQHTIEESTDLVHWTPAPGTFQLGVLQPDGRVLATFRLTPFDPSIDPTKHFRLRVTMP